MISQTFTITVNVETPTEPEITVLFGSDGLHIAVSGGPGNLRDWVGYAPVGSPRQVYSDWLYLSGTFEPADPPLTSAEVVMEMPPPGDYEARFYSDDSFNIIVSVVFTVT